MSILQAMVLGFIQGITEFLPISSSAHLVLTPYLLQWSIPKDEAFVFDVLVQVGTTLAVILYFWKDLWNIGRDWLHGFRGAKFLKSPGSRLGWMIIIATIPAGVLGLLLKKQVETAFNSPNATALFLLITAILLVISEKIGKRTRVLAQLTWIDAVTIGAFQALSIFPGISRSGSTIAGGMSRDFERIPAARFSFLMSVPVMLAAGLVALFDLMQVPSSAEHFAVLGIGFATSAIVGFISIHWLLKFLTKHSLALFAVYCGFLGLLVLLVGIIRPIGLR